MTFYQSAMQCVYLMRSAEIQDHTHSFSKPAQPIISWHS